MANALEVNITLQSLGILSNDATQETLTKIDTLEKRNRAIKVVILSQCFLQAVLLFNYSPIRNDASQDSALPPELWTHIFSFVIHDTIKAEFKLEISEYQTYTFANHVIGAAQRVNFFPSPEVTTPSQTAIDDAPSCTML